MESKTSAAHPEWSRIDDKCGDGVVTYRLKSWAAYFDFLETEVFSSGAHGRYIWRGQRRDDWSLSTSIDRYFDRVGLMTKLAPDALEKEAAEHLDAFRYATRGRRGVHPPKLETNEWWALGQHYGLVTPLLDWTRSPFAAAYFAFEEVVSDDSTACRVVYGVEQHAVERKSQELLDAAGVDEGSPAIIQFVDPLSDENSRLVSQGGLFTRAPIGVPVEHWVMSAFEGSGLAVLWRIEIPDEDRLLCLQGLSRMNINHLSLFPDLSGASRFVNLERELEMRND